VDAGSTASQSLEGGDYADIPLVGVVDGSRVAQVGGLSVNEEYHAGVSDLEHEPFLANLLDSLAGRTGTVLVGGGHRQFNESRALSNEDLVNYQQYLEGQGFPASRSIPSRGRNPPTVAPSLSPRQRSGSPRPRSTPIGRSATTAAPSCCSAAPTRASAPAGTSTTSPARSAPTSDSTPTRCTTTAPTSTTARRS